MGERTVATFRVTVLTFGLVLASLVLGVGTVLADSVSYTYDPLGRLVQVTYDNGSSIVYTYDAAGNRTSVVVSGVVASGIFHGHLTIQGRPAPPSATLQVPLSVSFLQPGTSTVLFSATPTADTSGNFVVTGLPPRIYDVQMKYALALSKLARAVVVIGGDNPTVNFGQLAVGDVNNDDVVDLVDFSILRTTFGRCSGDAGYDARADLNGDGCVDLIDFSLLRTNFGQVGPQTVP